MIEPLARDVLARLEARDAYERERGVARSERLRQITPEVGRLLPHPGPRYEAAGYPGSSVHRADIPLSGLPPRLA